ncbi:MAG: Flp pilus assembly complex ATPase component TadA [Candidatus Thermoplasmatota archaeon]|nr:Flp pilus assembly complex ATPase component TadA [Candidatus Thermoplasmatota archaeon]
MSTEENPKKVPLHHVKKRNVSDIEKQVDEIIKAQQSKPSTVPPSTAPPAPSVPHEKDRPSFFFVKSKKKKEPRPVHNEEIDRYRVTFGLESEKTENKALKPTPVPRKEPIRNPEKKVPSVTEKPSPPAMVTGGKRDVKQPSVPPEQKKHILFGTKKKEAKQIEKKVEPAPPALKKQMPPAPLTSSPQPGPSEKKIWFDRPQPAEPKQQMQPAVRAPTEAQKPKEPALREPEHHTLKDTPISPPQKETPIAREIRDDVEPPVFQDKPPKKGFAPLSTPTTFPTRGGPASTTNVNVQEITPDGHIHYSTIAASLKTLTLQHLGYSESTVEEIDFYPLQEPYAYVEIIRERDTLDKLYVLIEVELTDEEKRILQFIKETLTGFSIKTEDLEVKGEESYLNEKVDVIIDDYMLHVEAESKKRILYYLKKDFLGLGKLEVLMRDPNIEDISCDGASVYLFLYHRRYGSLKSNVQFDNEDELSAFVVKLAQKCGKHISIAEPMLDATMPDGSRIQMTLSQEVTTKGSTFTIRKFSEDPFSPPDLIEFNTMSAEMVAYMWLAVENGVNALIAGGTAAGKTSTLNALCLFIPRESKIVTIEETREIHLPHPNWIPGVVRSGFGEVVGNKVIGEIDLYDLMKAALRQRPEYILVGEIRGKEAYVLFQAMATGHTTYSTVHADSAQSLIHRLEGKPIEIPRIMLQALDIVCIQVISRVKNKRARRCKQIIEIIDIDPTTKEILTNEVFRWDPIEDKFTYSGKSYILERIRAEKDMDRETMISEIKNRTSLLEWMNKNNIREFKKVATLVAQYTANSSEVMKKIKE